MGTISPVTDLSSDPCHWIYFEISKTICWNLLYDQQPILDNSTHQTFEVSPLGDVEQILDPVGCLALAAARALHRPHLLPPALPPVPGLGVRAPHRAVQVTGAPPEPARELLHGGGPRHAHPAAVHPAGGGARGGAGARGRGQRHLADVDVGGQEAGAHRGPRPRGRAGGGEREAARGCGGRGVGGGAGAGAGGELGYLGDLGAVALVAGQLADRVDDGDGLHLAAAALHPDPGSSQL